MFGKILKYGAKALANLVSGKDNENADDDASDSEDDWEYKQKDYAAIVALVKRYEAKQSVIRASWEAGGDECPIYCTVDNATYPDEDERLFCKLSTLIIDRLDLPNAGEIYNNGFGTVYTKADKLYIRTTYLFFEEYYEDESEGAPTAQLRLKTQLPDPYDWSALIKRADLTVTASLDWKGVFSLELWLSVRDGDDYEISEEQQKFYEQHLKSEFEKFKSEFSKSKDGHPLYKLNVWHTMTNTLSLDAEIDSTYIAIHEQADEREIELKK